MCVCVYMADPTLGIYSTKRVNNIIIRSRVIQSRDPSAEAVTKKKKKAHRTESMHSICILNYVCMYVCMYVCLYIYTERFYRIFYVQVQKC